MWRPGNTVNGIYPYQTRVVRDLAWACFAPALVHTADLHPARGQVTDAAFELTAPRRLWLERLERDATPLLDYLAGQPGNRLGLYFERLWQFFLREDPETELVAHNLPVTREGSTLGEFDCIYFCHRRRAHVHLELAVKFYLGLPGRPAAQAWVGPNARDRLDIKLARLLEKQITLGDRQAAQAQLESLGIGAVQREIALRGYLFQPLEGTLPAPTGYNTGRRFGRWLHSTQLARLAGEPGVAGFVPLERMQWLAPLHAAADQCTGITALARGIDKRFATRNTPALVAAVDAAGNEQQRFFVVPPGWPDGPDPKTGQPRGESQR